MYIKKSVLCLCVTITALCSCFAQTTQGTQSIQKKGPAQSLLPAATITEVGEGWSGNSINTVVFRKNSIVSANGIQFISYYAADGYVMLGKRMLGTSKWELVKTNYKGKITDAHNCISIALDGDGFLHMSFDQHAGPLRYCKSKAPYSLELTDLMPMTGEAEKKVTYPEFYKLPDGDLLFLYRDGSSGNGNLVLNRYNHQLKKWIRVQNNLINGEGLRNAYWQSCLDNRGYIHLSWVWRESPDVASNHDMSYAVSKDGGINWLKSTGEKYTMPITQETAEKILSIPQQQELINQTSMSVDDSGNPLIASYWRGRSGVPQYHIIYHEANEWKVKDLGFRTSSFTLSGGGTKKIPVSRPQVISWTKGKRTNAAIVFRDEERGNKVSLAIGQLTQKSKWTITDLNQTDLDSWEPSFDTELWRKEKQLHLFVQKTFQADHEGITPHAPEMVQILELPYLEQPQK